MQWSEEFAFHELTESQQKKVLSVMSKNEYSEHYELNVRLNQDLQNDVSILSPNPGGLARLHMEANKKKQRAVVVPFWLKSVPMYGTAAACVLVFLISYVVFSKKQAQGPTNPTSTTKIVRDTIYLAKAEPIEYRIDTVLVEVQSPVNNSRINNSRVRAVETNYDPDHSEFVITPQAAPQSEGISKSYGNSPVATKTLEQFKTGMLQSLW